MDYTCAAFTGSVFYIWHYPAKEPEVVALSFTSALSNDVEMDFLIAQIREECQL